MPSCAATAWDVSTASSRGRRSSAMSAPPLVSCCTSTPSSWVASAPGGGHRVHGRRLGDTHRGLGWNRVHVAVDDHSRLAYVEELADESPASTAAFLANAS